MLHFFRQIKWFIQRGRRGYADCDVWDFDAYLISIIVPALKELKKDKMGCPMEFYDEKMKNDECHKWDEMIEEIIQGFEAIEALDCRSFKWFKKDHVYRKEFDKERLDVLTKKYEKGMQLFAKHFMSIWT